MNIVEIYTDGACKGNPGPGGWGALLLYNGTERELSGCDQQTTNNRMELQAVIEALSALNRPCSVRVVTDSQYVKNGITRWMADWKKRGWKTAAKKPVKNKDLWLKLESAAGRHDIEWAWVKGHAGNEGNERADQLASNAAENCSSSQKSGSQNG